MVSTRSGRTLSSKEQPTNNRRNPMANQETNAAPLQENERSASSSSHHGGVMIEALQSIQDTQNQILKALQTLTDTILTQAVQRNPEPQVQGLPGTEERATGGSASQQPPGGPAIQQPPEGQNARMMGGPAIQQPHGVFASQQPPEGHFMFQKGGSAIQQPHGVFASQQPPEGQCTLEKGGYAIQQPHGGLASQQPPEGHFAAYGASVIQQTPAAHIFPIGASASLQAPNIQPTIPNLPPNSHFASAAAPSAQASPLFPIQPTQPARFVTIADVQNMIQIATNSKPAPSLPDPSILLPYPMEYTRVPYPKGYKQPKFHQYDGRSGNAQEHVVRFIEMLSVYGDSPALRLREFSKSLTDRAYTWYVKLAPGSVLSWEDMVTKFLSKFFQAVEQVTTLQLAKEEQKPGEDLVDYIIRFQDRAMDCHEHIGEAYLVNLCINGTWPVFQAYLVNLKLVTFYDLLIAARNLKPIIHTQERSFPWTNGKRSTNNISMVSTFPKRKFQGEGSRGKKPREASQKTRQKEYPPAPEYPCSLEDVKVLVAEWVADGEITLPQIDELPTKAEKESPNFCVYHQHTKHGTADCWALRNIFSKKIKNGELRCSKDDIRDVSS